MSPDPFIAVVDDESPVRVMLGRLLRLADYRVIGYASGEEFLASISMLAGQQPACAIVDIHMPGLSGLEVLGRLRDSKHRIPVVFITASDDSSLERSTAELGAVRLLRKPFSSEELLAAVGVALSPPGGGA